MGTVWGPEPRDWAEEAPRRWEVGLARLCSLGSSICGAGARLPAPGREVTSGLQEAQVWGRWDPAGHLPAQEAGPPHLSGGAGMGGQPQIPRLGGGGLHWFCVFCGSGETEPGDHASLTDDVLCGQRGRACRQVGGPLKGIVSADRSGRPCGLHLLRMPGAVLNAPIHEAGTAGDTEAGG